MMCECGCVVCDVMDGLWYVDVWCELVNKCYKLITEEMKRRRIDDLKANK